MIHRKAAAVSMEPDLFQRAKKRSKELGFPTFSAYMVQLLRADLIRRGDMTLMEEPPKAQASALPPRKDTTYKASRKK